MTRFVAGMASPPRSGVQEHLLFKNLDPGATYFWKMYSECGDEQSREIGPLSFTTGVGGNIPSPPTLSSPANNSTILGTEVTWQWQQVTGAIDYNIRYWKIGSAVRLSPTGRRWEIAVKHVELWYKQKQIYSHATSLGQFSMCEQTVRTIRASRAGESGGVQGVWRRPDSLSALPSLSSGVQRAQAHGVVEHQSG